MDALDIFYFFCSGEGKGKSGATGRGGGSVFLIENPRRGVSQRGGARGPGVSAGNLGGVNIFFGAEMTPVY